MSVTAVDLAEAFLEARYMSGSDDYVAWAQERCELWCAAFGLEEHAYERPTFGHTFDDVERCYREVRSPFGGVGLEGSASEVRLSQRHADRLDEAVAAYRRRLAEVAAEILEAELGLPEGAVVSDDQVARHGALRPRPVRYALDLDDW